MIWLLFSALTALVIAAAMRPAQSQNGNRTRAFTALAPIAATLSIGAFCFLAGEPTLAEQPAESMRSVPSDEQALRVEMSALEEKVRANPDDAAAWSKLAPAYFQNGDLEKAAGAFRKVIELKSDNEEALLGLAETLIFGNNGDVTDAAKQALNTALQKNPKSGRGRLWIAIAAEQEGRKEEAQNTYRDMLNEDLTGPLRRMVTERLASLSSTHGEVAALHGGSSENAPKGHEGNIPEMVDRLAERLKTSGGSLDNWLMLIRSYYVLKDEAKAQDAVAAAKQKFASDSNALELIDSLVKEVTSPEAKAAEEAAAKAAEENVGKEALEGAPVGYPSHVVGEMVAHLAERLKSNQGSLEDWLKLIRSYSVLKDSDKAEDAAGAARKQFASDAKALEQIDALLQEVKRAPKS